MQRSIVDDVPDQPNTPVGEVLDLEILEGCPNDRAGSPESDDLISTRHHDQNPYREVSVSYQVWAVGTHHGSPTQDERVVAASGGCASRPRLTRGG